MLVVSNRPEALGVATARAEGIATTVIDHVAFGKDRGAFERKMQEALERHGVELLCLAGFMRLLTPWFVARWHNRMINIHPALLPAFKGLDTHARALAAGVKIHGASVHLVVSDVDAGPIIMQGAIGVREGDTEETLAARVLAIEHRIYPAALALLASGRIRIVDGRCLIEGADDPASHLIVPDI